MIAFVIKSTLCLFAIYFLYIILLAKENIPVFKRCFLLFGLLFSIVVPLIDIPVNISNPGAIYPLAINDRMNTIFAKPEGFMSRPEPRFPVSHILYAVYFPVFAVLSFRFIINIKRLVKLSKNSPGFIFNGYKIILTDSCPLPYSFFNAVYVNAQDYNGGTVRKELLVHELAHIRQKHTIDILLIELFQILFWFNPLLWLYSRAIRLNHEYLADREVVKSNVTADDYRDFMLCAVSRNNSLYLASSFSFNYSFIKKRLIMLTKEKSLPRVCIKTMMIVPVIAFCTAAISCNRDTMADEPSSEWWEPILQKHGIPLKAYNNFGNILEMGDRNSIDGSVCTLTNATVIIKGNSDDYSIIEGELVSHDLKKEILEVHSGSVKSYKMDAAPSNPSSTMTGASYFKFKINHYY